MSLRPPSTSPSPSPGPNENGPKNQASRQSMGPSARLAPASPRPGGGSGARPTSELLGGSSGYQQTPEAEALDQWFENLQNYEATLEEMAAASLDVNFKEELSAIEQWFKVLSEAERTAALYSLLQHSTQVQIRFFITVLQQMARSDPMTALLSPAMGSMQSQMEAKLATLKSPGLKSNLPASPTTRSFSGGLGAGAGSRQSLIIESPPSNFLSPDSATNAGSSDPAATLAHQRAKFKASNAAHRISAPILPGTGDVRTTGWGSALGQVAESNSTSSNSATNGGTQEITMPSSRPKSSDFSGTLGSPRPGAQAGGDATVPAGSDSWASMVNTPLIPMFQKDNSRLKPGLDSAANKLNDWQSKNAAPGVPRMGDPTIHRRVPKSSASSATGNMDHDDAGSPLSPQGPGQQNNKRNAGGWNNNNHIGGGGGMGGARSPGLSNTSSNRFNNPNDDAAAAANLLNMQMGNLGLNPSAFNGMGGMGGMPGMGGMGGMNGMNGMGSPGLGGMGGMPNIGGMPFNLNMLSAMGISPEAQILAAQMAAAGGFGGAGAPGWLGMQGNMGNMAGRRAPSVRSAGGGGGGNKINSGATPKAEDDVDPALLHDIPGWLRSLRLHKYTPNFEGMKWQDMVVMDEAQLEAKGVAALGARRKMLKTFELVRKKMGIEGGPAMSP
ncbi:Flap-structured DNA-binding and RNA-binding protein [Marasmius tenuissimus]|uniref:RNA-binding protein VTS1 n=1 Tax=Marasmius tenuissimus TaxID=585030 RepID=A0ABR2ZKE3_9AGAR